MRIGHSNWRGCTFRRAEVAGHWSRHCRMRRSKEPSQQKWQSGGASSHTPQGFLLIWSQGGSWREEIAFGIANGDGLRALLHDARGEVRTVAQSQWFSDDAHVIAGIQLQMTGLWNFGVAEVNVHLPRRA